jgi:hypothetical protein
MGKGNPGTTLLDAVVKHGHPAPPTRKPGERSSPPVDLNPAFVERLMGFATGWTDCGCSETPSCPSAPKSSAM